MTVRTILNYLVLVIMLGALAVAIYANAYRQFYCQPACPAGWEARAMWDPPCQCAAPQIWLPPSESR